MRATVHMWRSENNSMKLSFSFSLYKWVLGSQLRLVSLESISLCCPYCTDQGGCKLSVTLLLLPPKRWAQIGTTTASKAPTLLSRHNQE